MPELKLRLSVDKGALDSMERLTDRLNQAILKMGPETKTSLASFRTEVEKTSAAVKQMGGSFTQFARMAQDTSVRLRTVLIQQKQATNDNIHAMESLSAVTRKQAANVLALERVEATLNKELSEQARIKALLSTNGQGLLNEMRAETAELARQAHARGLLTERELRSIEAKTAEGAAIARQTAAYKANSVAIGERAKLVLADMALERGLQDLRAKGIAAGTKTANYAALAKEQELALAMNRIYSRQKTELIAKEAAHAVGINTVTSAYAKQNPVLRGVSGAMGKLWLTYGAILPMLTGFAAALTAIKGISVGSEFEYATTYMASVAKANDDYSMSLEQIKSKILGIEDTVHVVTELADASKELVKQGFSSAEAVNEIGEMSKLATIAEEDLAGITKAVAAQYRAWNVEVVGTKRGVSNLAETANMMGAAAMKSAMGVGDLAGMLKHTSELSVLSGASFSELLAMIGNMTNMGIRGTNVTTALRTSILHLQKPTSATAEMMKKLGVSFSAFDDTGRLKSAFKLYKDFFDAMQGLDDRSKTQMVTSVFGLRDLKAGASMVANYTRALKTGKDSVGALEEAIRKAGKEGTFLDGIMADIGDTAKVQFKELVAEAQKSLAEGFDAEGPKEFIAVLRDGVRSGVLGDFIALTTKLSAAVVKLGQAYQSIPIYLRGPNIVDLAKYAGSGPGVEETAIEQTISELAKETRDNQAVQTAAVEKVSTAVSLARTTQNIVERKLAEAVAEESRLRSTGGDLWERFTGSGQDRLKELQQQIAKLKSALTKSKTEARAAEVKASEAETSSVVEPVKLQDPAVASYKTQLEFARGLAAIKAEEAKLLAGRQSNINLLQAQNKAEIISNDELFQATRRVGEATIRVKQTALEKEIAVLQQKRAVAEETSKLETDSVQQRITNQKAVDDIDDAITKAKASLSALNVELINYGQITLTEATARNVAFEKSLTDVKHAADDLARSNAFDLSTKSLGRQEQADRQRIEDSARARAQRIQAFKESNEFAPGTQASSDAIAKINSYYDTLDERVRESIATRKTKEADWRAGAAEGFRTYAEDARNVYSSTAELAQQSFKTMEDSFVEFVRTGKTSFEGFVDTVIDGLLRIAIQQNITAPLADAMPSFGSFLGNLFANGGVMTPNGALPLNTYATGGIATGPQVAVYGEGRKNEAYVPLPDNRTIPVTLTGGGGAAPVIVNIIEDSSKAGKVQQRQQQNGPNIIDVFVEQVESKMASRISNGKGLAPTLESKYNLNPAWGMVR